jgi:hypothetical protein
MPRIKHHIAHAFGTHSKKVWRCVIGATWSLPLRYVTLTLQVAAMGAVAGAVVHIPDGAWWQIMSAGVAVGWAIRLADNLVNEYLVFKNVKRFFTLPPNKDTHARS